MVSGPFFVCTAESVNSPRVAYGVHSTPIQLYGEAEQRHFVRVPIGPHQRTGAWCAGHTLHSSSLLTIDSLSAFSSIQIPSFANVS